MTVFVVVDAAVVVAVSFFFAAARGFATVVFFFVSVVVAILDDDEALQAVSFSLVLWKHVLHSVDQNFAWVLFHDFGYSSRFHTAWAVRRAVVYGRLKFLASKNKFVSIGDLYDRACVDVRDVRSLVFTDEDVGDFGSQTTYHLASGVDRNRLAVNLRHAARVLPSHSNYFTSWICAISAPSPLRVPSLMIRV